MLLDCLPRYLQMHISSSPKNEKKIIKRNPVLAGKIFEGAEAYTLWLFYNIMGWIQSGKVMRTVCCSSHLGGEGVCPGSVCLPGVSARGVSAQGVFTSPTLWTEFLTHAYENITLPQLCLRTVTITRGK